MSKRNAKNAGNAKTLAVGRKVATRSVKRERRGRIQGQA